MDTMVILSKKRKVCYVKATYVEPVTFTELKIGNNSIKSEDEITLDLLGKPITNPKTGVFNYISIFLILIGVGFLLYKHTSKKSIILSCSNTWSMNTKQFDKSIIITKYHRN